MRILDWLWSVPWRVRSSRLRRNDRHQRHRQRVVELLESRALPSAVTFTGDAHSAGVLWINLSEPAASSIAVSSTVIASASGPVDVVRVWINGSQAVVRQSNSQATLNNLHAKLVAYQDVLFPARKAPSTRA